ncbi:MAG: alpha/beta hydrolase [Victivallaceae bacterium]|nr:alpha/beta hydrolase [Victivallaceae bacterium]
MERRLKLWESNRSANGDFEPFIELHPLSPEAGSALGTVLVVPGGGYETVCLEHEGGNIAERFNQLGFHAAVLVYRTAPRRYPDPQLDMLRAVQLLRFCGCGPIAAAGFSAGGHLALCAGTLAGAIDVVANDGADKMNPVPDALILCYPVVTAGEYAHRDSFRNLTGERYDTELTAYLSLENRVSDVTPPLLVWHTAQDTVVPVENSLLLEAAMRRIKRPCELHVFPYGDHGLGLAENNPAAVWPELAAAFLRRHGFR